MEVSEANRLKALEAENAKLKRMLADAMLEPTASEAIASFDLIDSMIPF
jgi:hypothetical protein